MALEKITICITGSSGFIGSHLVERLKEKNNVEVVLFKGDLLNKEVIKNFFNAHQNIDQIIHLVGGFFGDFEKLFLVNVLAINNLLEQALKFNIKKIIYASTGAIYGEPLNGVSKENDKLNPNTIYGLTKMYAEECIYYYAKKHNIKYVILRFSNVYGPKNEKGVICNFLKSIKEHEKIIIFGTGLQKRNFLFVDDAVEALCNTLWYEGVSDIFNIASSEVYNLNEIVTMLKSFALNFIVEYQSAEESNNLQILFEDISKAKRELMWEPKTSLNIGINKILNFK